jgi:hypothetical protein
MNGGVSPTKTKFRGCSGKRTPIRLDLAAAKVENYPSPAKHLSFYFEMRVKNARLPK